MPYIVRKRGSKWCVLNSETGGVVKCHSTRKKALAHMRALYANVEDAKEAAMDEVLDEIGAGEASELDEKGLLGPVGEVSVGPVDEIVVGPVVPPGVTSFAELRRTMEAENYAREVSELARQFTALLNNILINPEIEDKEASIRALVSEFGSLVTTASSEDEAKALDDLPEGEEGLDEKARWDRAYINDLPDSAFLYIEPGGEKDEEGKTVPRRLRHLPYKDHTGKVDLPHLRNAIARLEQAKTGRRGGETWLTESLRKRLLARARRILAEHTKETKAKWDRAYINDLPDSAFLYIEPGGKKDEEGKTVPRYLRHLPYKDHTGKVDLPHLRNAIQRLSQPATGERGGRKWLTESLRKRLLARARRILREHTKSLPEYIGIVVADTVKAWLGLDLSLIHI